MNNRCIPDFKHYPNEQFYKKGWGGEHWLLNNEKLCCKVLTLEKNKKSSLHFHLKKEEIFFVIKGAFALSWVDTQDGTEYTRDLSEGESVFIPTGTPHRFRGISEQPCIFLEASTHHEEHDSYRVSAGDSQNIQKNDN